jgi:trimethyllysine dioxygenase
VRETHYGKFWEFTADLKHGDTAYTNIALPAHTDTTYFTDPVGLQFFHLLEHRGSGGESLYVDGFNVALQLQKEQKWAFDALTRIKITAHSAGDQKTLIQPNKPFNVIGLDELGHLNQIRYNNDDRSALKLTNQETQEFYAALHEWTKILRKKENELWIKLKPGLAVMMNNWRVLHGRSSFTGYRRMCGSYHNFDDFQSKIKTTLNTNIDI